MGCRSDYLEPTRAEVDASKVLALLEEVKTGKLPDYFGNGSYSEVYGGSPMNILKKKVPILCGLLQTVNDVSKYSLELQMWWRDHQEADKERLQEELDEKKLKKEKKKALGKLTQYERNLLGLL